ncbi:MAG: hypothetical protein KGI25_05550 [Thaumarchaeota archaeon]|nr:hypothetical protein [Nitrososphaerota archaeon]
MIKTAKIDSLLIITTLVVATPMAFAQYYEIHRTTLILDHIPRTVKQGYHLTFSGKLFTTDSQTPLQDRLVFIEYDNPYDCTKSLTSTTTDRNGNFFINWTAMPKGYSGGTYNLFAKFNGDDKDFYSISNQYLLNVIPQLQNGFETSRDITFTFGPCD